MAERWKVMECVLEVMAMDCFVSIDISGIVPICLFPVSSPSAQCYSPPSIPNESKEDTPIRSKTIE